VVVESGEEEWKMSGILNGGIPPGLAWKASRGAASGGWGGTGSMLFLRESGGEGS